jgi:thiol-disulfide isomerase/thioredoxin
MILRFFILIFSLTLLNTSKAQETGYQISVTIDEFEEDTVFLAYRRADKVYSRDTAALVSGKFIFKGEKALPTGIYLILMPPDNKYFEFVVSEKEQQFEMITKAPDYYGNLTFNNAPDNQLLYDYQNYMNDKVKESQTYQENLATAADEASKANWQKQLERLQEQVRVHQSTLIKQNQDKFTSKLIGAFLEPDVPDAPIKPDGTTDDTFQFRYFRDHYFDSFDFSESGMVNTPYLKQKVEYYLDKLTPQDPDSLNNAVDYILAKAQGNEEVFRYTISMILNRYYRPKIVGLDAVYVHVANKYYRTGIVDWVTEENLKKILDDAYMIQGVLIGNPAPEVSCNLYDYETKSWTDSLVNLYDIDTEWTVVFLWKPGCPACKEMTKDLKTFYAEWKDKGVEIYAISSANHKNLEKAKKDIEEKEVNWITVADPYLKARALMKYYGTSLPKVYLLDKNKTIRASRVGASQLAEIIMKEQEKENN